jgi:hypothetical protein
MTTIPLSKSFSLPLDIAARRSCIFGMSGSGKSNTATVIVEGLVKAGEQVVVVDPKGEGWGLTSSATGKSEGLDVVVFGEPNGHIAKLDESHGETLADFVVDSGQSVVLSLLGFESDQAERRFVARFFKRLYRRKSTQPSRTRTLVVLEEAHLFVPEFAGTAGNKGDKAELVGAIQRCVRQGRSFGLGSLLVDQRPQDVSKRLVSQAELLVVHMLAHNTDRKALKEWTDGFGSPAEQADLLDNLAQLQPGEAFVWSPAWLRLFERVKVARRTTFDSGATPDGSAASLPTKRTKVDLEKLRGKLDAVIERAKADDPAELRKEIARLKREAVSGQPSAVSQAEVDRAVHKAVAERDKHWRDTLAQSEWQRKSLVGKLTKIEQLAHVNGDGQEVTPPAAMVAGKVETRRPSAVGKPPQAMSAAKPLVPSAGDVSLGKAERACLVALYWLKGEAADAAKVGFYADYSSRSSTFQNAMGRLRSLGLASGWKITPAGEALIPADVEPKPSGATLHAWLRNKLGKAERSLLDVLVAASGERLDTATIAERSGYSAGSSTFQNALGKLRTLDAAEGYERDGGTKAAAVFFE